MVTNTLNGWFCLPVCARSMTNFRQAVRQVPTRRSIRLGAKPSSCRLETCIGAERNVFEETGRPRHTRAILSSPVISRRKWRHLNESGAPRLCSPSE